ncbi:putative transcriptional regulator [Catenibacillus scindens]|uniref:Putative transcriptional regulator n=1 Tax=Catenibacillus scindens TaxID=673271 RepID=A0A7W8M4T3_9FIRM|nr:toxin-antitoxin system protein [Catenibacillus scindens]MBB5264159.1 putative transcriptional regulator [Catenibacillus scindens]
MNPKPLKVKVSITLDSNLVEKIIEMANEDDRNFSQYINYVLKDWIKRETDTDVKG